MRCHQFPQSPQSDDHQVAFRAEFRDAFRVVFKAESTTTQTDDVNAHNKMLRPRLLLAGELEHSQNNTTHRILLD